MLDDFVGFEDFIGFDGVGGSSSTSSDVTVFGGSSVMMGGIGAVGFGDCGSTLVWIGTDNVVVL